MRIVHIITTLELGGAEKQLLVLVQKQIAMGHSVSVIPLKGNPVLAYEFEKIGARNILTFLNKSFWRQIFEVKKFIFGKKDLILHAHLPRAEVLVSFLFHLGPTIATRHNFEPFFPGSPWYISRTLSKWVSSRFIFVICISNAVRKYVIENKEISDLRKLVVVPYGFNPDQFSDPNENARIASLIRKKGKTLIGTVGRLVPQKDYPTLLRAFADAFATNPNLHLVILGEGFLDVKMKALASNLGIVPNVTWVGKSSKVNAYLSNFDVFILCSAYEGFGAVLLEAMAQGVPIVAANNSAIPEVMGVDYPYLCSTGDFKDFSSKLILLTENPKLGSRDLSATYKERLSLFDPNKMAEKIDQIYFQACSLT